MDVNLLLFCCWAGVIGAGALGETGIRHAVDAVECWQSEVVRPLRMVRRRLKSDLDNIPNDWREALRLTIGRSELDVEHIEQLVLGEMVTMTAQPKRAPERCAANAAANLATYFALAGVQCGEDECHRLAIILAACFPQLEEVAVTQILISAFD